MKYAILFASKAGGTESSAKILKEKLVFEHQIDDADITIINIAEKISVDLESYDRIVVGTGIYMGKANKKVLSFIERYKDTLLKKPLSMYICALADNEEEHKKYLATIPSDILNHAEPVTFFGGTVIFKRLNFFTAFLMKRITKSNKDVHKLKHEEIKKFANKIA
jgi:menaquinone-dependent protoporphyrinogen oxidase